MRLPSRYDPITNETVYPDGTRVPTISNKGVATMTNYPRPDVWSTLTITYENGLTESRNLKASPSLLKHLLSEARETGWLYMFDDKSSEALPLTKDILSIRMVQLTTD